MIFITDKIRENSVNKSGSIIRRDVYSISTGIFLSYGDLVTGNTFPLVIQNNSKKSNMIIYEESGAYDSIEIFDETDGGMW